jgi:mono/diheme cytochrome c family protein
MEFNVRTLVLSGFVAVGAVLPGNSSVQAEVDFVRDVQAIFQERCWDCHGADTREGGLRLDQKRHALAGGDSGESIVPGEPENSLLITYVSGEDPDRLMPPDGDNLSADEVAALKAWIKQGAVWPDGVDPEVEAPTHWAYQPITRPQPPEVSDAESVVNAIDRFVVSRLEQEGIGPSPEADRHTLIKRLHYDLLGLPPTPDEVDAFLSDSSPGAYERLVDRLLQSPHFGERWGRHWLDAARYADSDGYEKDRPRHNAWKYRDWVIQAINDDMPYDQFTVDQIAGDLLPDAGPEQLLATAFHRQTLTNTEGGTDQEEFRVEAVFDRVETIGTVWLGLTLTCARCHSHKYDDISQREYYQLFAFFNNGDEVNTTIPTSPDAFAEYQEKKKEYDARLQELTAPLNEAREQIRPRFDDWAREQTARWRSTQESPLKETVLKFDAVRSVNGATLEELEDGSYLASGDQPQQDVYELEVGLEGIDVDERAPITGVKLEALTHDSLTRKGPGWSNNGNFVLSEITLDVLRPEQEPARQAFARATADHSQNNFEVEKAIDGEEGHYGWAISPQIGKDHWAQFVLAEPIASLASDARLKIRLSQQYERNPHLLGRFRVTLIQGISPETLGYPEEIQKILDVAEEKRDKKQNAALFDHFASLDAEVARLQAKVDEFKKQEPFKPEMVVPVIREREKDPRTTHVFRRGHFLDPLGEVQPETLEILPRLPAGDEGHVSRLDFARWLVSEENPLTPRVTVNQVWERLFGRGLVKTLNDFGVRGERPTHPELLDWLAVEFLENGWSRKHLIKTIVLSRTYRQSSAHRSELADVDPNNNLLYRQNRFRVEAEIVRDLYLAASGLLEPRIGGPSVFPPLPPGIAELSYANNFRWGNSDWNDRPDNPHRVPPREDVHRRGMYTFFKRTAPHPNLITFDCPDSNTTTVDRNRSNTPLQALQTLNNETFVEASRALADRLLSETGEGERPLDDSDRLITLFRLCVARPPTSDELRALEAFLADARSYFREHPQEAAELLGTEGGDGDGEPHPRETHAAWVAVSRIAMNLDEFLTRE